MLNILDQQMNKLSYETHLSSKQGQARTQKQDDKEYDLLHQSFSKSYLQFYVQCYAQTINQSDLQSDSCLFDQALNVQSSKQLFNQCNFQQSTNQWPKNKETSSVLLVTGNKSQSQPYVRLSNEPRQKKNIQRIIVVDEENSISQLKNVRRITQTQDLAALYKIKTNVEKVLQFLKENQQIYPKQELTSLPGLLQKDAIRLLNVLSQPGAQLQKLTEYFKNRQFKPQRAQNQQIFKTTDYFYRNFVNELQSQINKNSNYIVQPTTKQKVKLFEAMGDCDQIFEESSKWRQVLLTTQYVIQQLNLYQNRLDMKSNRQLLKKQAFSQEIYNKLTHNTKKLCCTQFFLKDRNIYDPYINQGKIAILGSIKKIDLQQTADLIVKEVCGLLNGGGGTLLFDCSRQYYKVVAKGQKMIEQQKQSFIKSIQKITEKIYPRPKIKQNIIISFVPIVQDIIKKGEEASSEIKYTHGVYVTRLVVRPPKCDQQEFYYEVKDELKTSIRYKSLLNNPESIKQAPYQAHKQTKEIECFQQTQKHTYLSSSLFDFDHETCQSPHQGVPVKNKSYFNTIETNLEKKYEFTSAMAVRIQYADKISQRLKEKYKVECQIVARFKHYKFKFAPAILIVYHSIPFRQFQEIMNSNEDFRFEGRFVMLSQVTDHVKLLEKNNRSTVENSMMKDLQKWVDIQFQAQRLKVQLLEVQTQSRSKEFYIRAGSKTANLFVYLLLNSNGDKCALKNPKFLKSSLFNRMH